MASGRLGTAALVASTNTTVYQVINAVSVISINVVNTGATNATIRLAIATSGTPGAGDWIEYGSVIVANGVLERTGMVLGTGEFVVAWTDSSSVVVRVHGYEE